MRTWVARAFFVLFLPLGIPAVVSACDCAYPGAPCKAFAVTPYIFSGRVTRVAPLSDGHGRQVTFELKTLYRGLDVKKTAVVLTGLGGGDCGFHFQEGQEYLVYAQADPSGKLRATICSRTRRLAEAVDDLEYLSKKDDPRHGAGIEGWIDELTRGPDNRTEVTGPLPDARVMIENSAGLWTVTTDQNGRFRLWGLAPGTYLVKPQFSAKYVPESGRRVVLEPKSCQELRFLATPPGYAASR